jgi:small-conductance mechanosensitive channel
MSATLPSKSFDDDIYTGFWINRATKSSYEVTLTLNRQMGGLVIAFLALFIGALARSLWKIVRFTLHVNFATPNSKDGLHHQRQAILRNTALALDTALSLFRANMAWRNRGARLQRRTLPIALAALAVAIASALAGLVPRLSARVAASKHSLRYILVKAADQLNQRSIDSRPPLRTAGATSE